MKLGDNMTAVEASCGVWDEACPRKTRPPRIGDIPRYTAVDEESPGSGSRRLGVPLSSVDSRKTEEMLELRLQSTHGDVFSPKTGPVQKSQKSEQVGCETSSDTRVPAVTVVGDGRCGGNQVDKDLINNSESRGSLLRICSTPSQEIREVRKDSALYLEEVEGLKDLRESLRSRTPRSLTPRRESSGYASNLGTFDEERRTSEADLTGARERRRSSTKRLTSETFIPTTRRIVRGETNNAKIPVEENILIKSNEDDDNDDDDNDDYKEDKSSEAPSYAEVLACKSLSTINNEKEKLSSSKIESFDCRYDVPAASASASASASTVINKPIALSTSQRKRIIVHQCSTPNFPIMELESISEKPVEKLSTISVSAISHVENNQELNILSTNNLPRSVKVYQLLSTQSEDRGDGVPNLSDRRISLQITRQEEAEGEKEKEKEKEIEKNLEKSIPEENRDSKVEGGRVTLSVPAETTGIEETGDPSSRHLAPCLPVRKLSTPGEMGASKRLLGDTGIGIRPIYPYCPYSPYGSPQGSPRTRRRPLRESRRVSIDNRQGALQLNQYKLLDNIGQGSFGIVKLAYNEEDETHYAMKILSKKKLMKKAGIFGRMAPGRKGLANPLAKVYREIALLKKLDHPNVVKLVEVLDDPDEDNLYLAFELVQRGEVLQLPTDQPLDEETARTHFRDIVMGVEYLHYQRIVHRDIKPSNLLVDSEGRVKVADLGVSAELRASGELLSGPAGTPAFAAPETTTPGAQYSGTLCDVWSMGVTLYSLVTGKVPWDGSGSIIGVQAAVRSEPLKFPDEPKLSESLQDLISRMLEKEPEARLSITEIKKHPWVTRNGSEILPSESDNCRLPVTVTDEEVARVVTRVPKLDTLILIKTMLKQHSFQNPFLPKRSTKSVSSDPVATEGSTTLTKIKGNVLSENSNTRAEKFHEAGRSNSAPDTFDCHLSDRPVTVENPLPPVTEASTQESDSNSWSKR